MTLFYGDTIPQPPPLAAGAPLQSYQDPMGDVWVAKGGIRGGQWRRARNVLRARVQRSTSWTAGAAGWNWVPFDAISWDEYGCMTLNNAQNTFTCPLAGFWRGYTAVQMSAVFTRVLVCLAVGAGDTNRGSDVNASVMGGIATDILNLNAGDHVGLECYFGTASSVVWYSGSGPFLTLEYHAPPQGT